LNNGDKLYTREKIDDWGKEYSSFQPHSSVEIFAIVNFGKITLEERKFKNFQVR
jgi:hypothetical protein